MDSEFSNSDADVVAVEDDQHTSVKLMATPSTDDDSSSNQQQQQRPKQTMKLKRCSFEDCKETIMRGKSGPWMCKYHRNKTYKETYKKKKGRNNQNGSQHKKMGDRCSPTLGGMYNSREQQEHNKKVTMMGHVLNEKKLALMKSPMVQAFLQEQQHSLCNTRHHTFGLIPDQMM